jgi:outer membrane protein TolC
VRAIVALLISSSLLAAAPKEAIKLNLNTAIERMIKHNGELASERKGLDFAEGRIDQANAAWFPKAELYLLAAPIFEEKGNALGTVKNYSKWGVFADVKMTVLQPLYTFGIISEYKKAAKSGYEVEIQKVKTKQAELVYRVKQFYYGAQLAKDLFEIVKDGREKMDTAIGKAEDMLKRNKIKREDLFSLKAYYAQILTRYDEASRVYDLAKKALAWTIGLSVDSEIELEDESIVPEEVELKTQDEYVAETLVSRPELKMLTSGIDATKSLWQGQAKQKRPIFFAMAYGNAAYTGVRSPQHNVFLNDPFNDLSGAILFGFKFNLDWWSINALSKQSKAEYEKLVEAKDTLTEGMILQVEKSYREAVDHKNAITYTKEGETNANKWMINAFLGYGMGFNEARDLTDSLKAYFEAQLNYNLSIYNFNMALADLTKYMGKEAVPSIKY